MCNALKGSKASMEMNRAIIKWRTQCLSFISFMILFNVVILPKDIQNIVSLRCSLQSRVSLLQNYWHCGLCDSFGGWGGDCARHCKMFSNTPGLYLLDTINIPTLNLNDQKLFQIQLISPFPLRTLPLLLLLLLS